MTTVPVGAAGGYGDVALVLDWVDGQVARRTGTVTAFGARFDMEVDAFLILVLSVYVAGSFGPWVLAIGLARYALLAAERVLAVAAAAGAAAVLAQGGRRHPGRSCSPSLPPGCCRTTWSAAALVGALLLLAESFGRDVLSCPEAAGPAMRVR